MNMRIFGLSEAKYYCSSFTNSRGHALKSINEFQTTELGHGKRIIAEGSTQYQAYRDCSLRDVERCLFLAVSHYRRSLDLMLASSSHWAQVTLYYGNWFASRALLGMRGGWMLRGSLAAAGR